MSKNYSSQSNSFTSWFSNSRTASLLMLFMVLFSSGTFAQVANYVFTQSSSTYTALSTSTTILAAGWDDHVTTSSVALPFTFRLNNIAYGAINVNSNGYITMGPSAPSATNRQPISSTAT